MRYAKDAIRVCLFCGGRGSSSIIRELLRRPQIELNLLINAYDDGLSTGALRDFIPGMLGPSDFRKNLSYLLDLSSAQQYALQQLFEFRLPIDFSESDLSRLRKLVDGDAHEDVLPALAKLIGALGPEVRNQCFAFLRQFFNYYSGRVQKQPIQLGDCSFGNLIFAGAYLAKGSDFNAAASALAELVGSRGRLINVSDGECRVLVGVKADGTVLTREAEIVGPQNAAPILDTFFFETAPGEASLGSLPTDQKLAWLKDRQTPTRISLAAAEALATADVIIFGPGTQHSSLLPSYRIAKEAVLKSPARVKAFVVNLREDNDIQGFSATDLADRALYYLDDPLNLQRGITHIFYSGSSNECESCIRLNRNALSSDGTFRGATIIEGSFENPLKQEVHNGFLVVRGVLDLLAEQSSSGARGKRQIEVFVDLLGRSLALDLLVQEIQEIPWEQQFRRVNVFLNRVTPPKLTESGPAKLSFLEVNNPEEFSEIVVVKRWLQENDTDYLVTMTGDGEYRFRDILLAVRIFEAGNFGVILGSRMQSRRQFQSTLRAAYGESGLMYHLSRLGAFLVSALFALRCGVILSDPLTGFRLYHRPHLSKQFEESFKLRSPRTTTGLTRLLINSKVEVAEIPVTYVTFRGFTNPGWRFRRGFRNLLGVFS